MEISWVDVPNSFGLAAILHTRGDPSSDRQVQDEKVRDMAMANALVKDRSSHPVSRIWHMDMVSMAGFITSMSTRCP